MHHAGPTWKSDMPFLNILSLWTDDLALKDAISGVIEEVQKSFVCDLCFFISENKLKLMEREEAVLFEKVQLNLTNIEIRVTNKYLN
jgi:signal transduction histidine kinase